MEYEDICRKISDEYNRIFFTNGGELGSAWNDGRPVRKISRPDELVHPADPFVGKQRFSGCSYQFHE